jgi:hypothetical protein
MGAIKAYGYSENEWDIAKFGKGIGHPMRKKLLDLLKKEGWCRNVDFSRMMNVSPSTVKEHVDFLVLANLVRIRYSFHHYEILLNVEGFKVMQDFLDEMTGVE